MGDSYIMIMTNCRDDREAEFIIEALFADKLVACVQTNKVHSHYYWQGGIRHDNEIRLLIKTKKSKYTACEEKIKSIHSYELPEIIEIPLTNGSHEFLNWIDFATK